MIPIKESYATIWTVEDKGKYIQSRISTSEKDKEGKYINSNWFASFVGKAAEKARALSQKDRIKITSGKVTNTLIPNGEEKKSFLKITIFDFEMNGESKKQEESIDDLPF